jgi:hypothetical protein
MPIAELSQIGGALLILAGFAGNQAGYVTAESRTYLLVNAVGAGVLAVLAYLDNDQGFLLLEGSWAGIALLGLFTTHTIDRTWPHA